MRWKLGLLGTIAVGVGARLWLPRPAAARCNTYCPEFETWEIALVSVEIVEGDPDADPPDWAPSGRVEIGRIELVDESGMRTTLELGQGAP